MVIHQHAMRNTPLNTKIKRSLPGAYNPLIGKEDIMQPVIRIDYKGRILYANKAAFPILKEWNCLANDYLPEEFTHEHPFAMDLDVNASIQIETPTARYHFDVIGFRESGYIGFYGFHHEVINPQQSAGQEIRPGRL